MDNVLFYCYLAFMILIPTLSALGGSGHGDSLTPSLLSSTALALSSTIAWRRLRWVPVAGELVGEYRYPGTRPAAFVRYEFCGRVYESQDSIPLGLGRHGTVWVDPAHPFRILPPSWRFRLLACRLTAALAPLVVSLTAAICAGWVTW